MLKLSSSRRAAAIMLALAFVALPSFGQRIARSRSKGLAPAGLSARAGYFPLAAGNSWTYKIDRFGPEEGVTVEVREPVEIEGVAYFPVAGLGSASVLLRHDARGRLLEYKREEGREALWFDFGAPVGGNWTPELPDGCTGEASLAARHEPATVPAGTFSETAVIRYGPGACADAGVSEDVFAAGVGLLRRTETTIAGPRTMSLTRARVNGRTVEAAGLRFSVRIDRPSYSPNFFPPVDPDRAIPVLTATVTVENTTDSPVTLTFPTPQLFDLSIRNAAGEVMYWWSSTRLFPAMITEVELGRRVLEAEAPLGAGREPWPAGQYVLEAWLLRPEGKAFSGSVGFQITEPAF